MRIAAISSIRNEEAIIRQTVTHLLHNGVDEVLVSDGGSTDWTASTAEAAGATVIPQEGPFRQDEEITRLAHLAAADWIIPFDADEFWCAPNGQTIRQVLEAVPDEIGSISCLVYNHPTWEQRAVDPRFFPKLIARYHPDLSFTWGNHDGVTIGERGWELLEVRELQYRDWTHFQQKIDKARQLHATGSVPPQYGGHMQRLFQMNDLQLAKEWERLSGEETVYDPISYRGTLPQ